MAELIAPDELREVVRERYASAAWRAADPAAAGGCCGGDGESCGAGLYAGALTREEYERHLAAAGLLDIEIAETHRVHEHAGSAIVRARAAG